MAKIQINEEELKDLDNQGILLEEIATHFNCGVTTILNRLKKMGMKSRKEMKEPVKNKIKDLYLEGKTSKEIGEIVSLDERTVRFHLKNMGVKTRPVKKIDQKKFEELWNEGKTDEEIAEYFGVKTITIKTFRTRGDNAGKFNQIRYFSQTEQRLSDIQEQFILGSLLGDMNLSKPRDRYPNSRLALVHCEKQKELFMKKVELLGDFMGGYKYCTPKPDSRTGKVYTGYRGNSKAHPIFTEIYNLLYLDGIKTITNEYLEKINHPIALAYWFMDDGTYNGTIATNSFSYKECCLLQNWLLNKWDISVSIQQQKDQYTLHIDKFDRFKFEKLIYPHMVPSMYYKLKHLQTLSEVC